MRNSYPLPKPITEEVPYTVQVNLPNGEGFAEYFPSYSTALEYYSSDATRGENVRHVSMRPSLPHELPE